MNNVGITNQNFQNRTTSFDTSAIGSQKILQLLVKEKILNQNVIDQAKIEAINKNASIQQVLQNQRKITDEQWYRAKAQTNGYKYINVGKEDISIDVLNRLSKDVAEKNMAVAFAESQGKVSIAMGDPEDLQKLKFLQVVIGKPVEVFLSPPSQIRAVIDRQYGARITEEVEEALSENKGSVLDLSSGQIKAESEDVASQLDSAPVTRIVNMILEYAVKYKASDIHVETRENKIVVRFRISGVLIEKLTLPKTLSQALVSRIKILSNLKIDEHRLPQDGRFQIKFDEKLYDLRVSIMPNVMGEKVVLRVLESGNQMMSLEELGLRGLALKTYTEALKKTEGIILVTGPTGSGKTRTLASSLDILNNPAVNIQTLEDPVEIRMSGITQVQVNPEIGLDFASGLRSFLRQDPDIIMVGEIRDKETANLAVQASLTGHLVLATLHSNYSGASIPRLQNMDVESFLLASTINAIMAQRLVRKICTKCKRAYEATPKEAMELKKVLDGLNGFNIEAYPPNKDKSLGNKIVLYKGDGCTACNGTGYSGRIGIYEVMSLNERIAELIMEHKSAMEIQMEARKNGMITMKQDGYLKILEGITTLSEVLRVVN